MPVTKAIAYVFERSLTILNTSKFIVRYHVSLRQMRPKYLPYIKPKFLTILLIFSRAMEGAPSS